PFFHSPGMDQIRLNAFARSPDQQRIQPEKRSEPKPDRRFQAMKNRAIALEREAALDPSPQQKHVYPQTGIFFEFREQHHLPGRWMAARQSTQWFRQVREPFHWK